MNFIKTMRMRTNILTLAAVIMVFFYAACQPQTGSADLDSELDSVSYSIGVDMAQNMKAAGLDSINHHALAKGIADALALEEEDLEIHPSMARQIISSYMTSMRTRTLERNKQEGLDYLAKNLNEEGVQSTESGLQYLVIEEGDGEKPDENDRVTVHYTGKTIDGKVFDSSVERGEPTSFGLNQVIPGWSEGLQLMQEGAKWRLFIPSELGYGERGAGPDIGPNATLIFDVELISIEKVDNGSGE